MDNEANSKDTAEQTKTKKKRLSKDRLKQILAISLIAVIIVVGLVLLMDYSDRIVQEREEKYQTAIELTFDGKYDEAIDVLDTFTSKYKDSNELEAYCRGHIEYDKGNILAAYKETCDINTFNLSEENKDVISAFQRRVKKEYLDAAWGRYFDVTTTEPTTVPPTTKRKSYKSDKKEHSSDWLGAEDYLYAEDFYYDNEYYFADYEEAEDYFNEHH